jgi:hypothetical protein
MRTVPHGNAISTRFTPPVGILPGGHERVPVSSEDLVRAPAAASRSPSNVESFTRSALPPAEEMDEILVEDVRAGVTPAEMVEQKLRSLLRTRGISLELSGRARAVRGPGR